MLGVAVALFVGASVVAFLTLPPLEGDVVWAWLLLAAGVGVPVTILLNAAEYATSAAMVGGRVPLGEAVRVSVLSSAANLLPVPGAPIVRVAALRRLGHSVGRSASSTGLVGLAWLGVTAILAGALIAWNGERPFVGFGLLIAGGAATAITWVAVVRHLRPPSAPAVVARLITVEAATSIVAASRLLLVIRGLGFQASIDQAMALTIAGVASSAVAVLRGLGVRELAAAVLSPIVGIDASVGLAATAVAHLSELALLAPFTLWLALQRSRARTPVEAAS